MLIRFQLENFLSFNHEQNFSMIASNLRTKKEHVFTEKNVNLLNLSAVYGANASGKTNFIKGIDLFRWILMNQLPSDTNDMYFRSDVNNADKPTKFEVEFIKNDSIYAYGVQLNLKKRIILSEWLYELYPLKDSEVKIYERKLKEDEYVVDYNKDIITGEDETRLKFVITDMKTNKKNLLMNEMNRNKNIEKDSKLYFFEEVYNWFQKDLKVFFPDDPITDFDYVIKSDDSENRELNNLVSSFDTGISKVTLEKIKKEETSKVLPENLLDTIVNDIRANNRDTESDEKQTKTSVLRNKENFFQISNITDDDYDLETIKLRHGSSEATYDFREESDGTRRLFDLLDILLNSDHNKIFVVDELDRSLHPNLIYKFIELYYEVAKNKNIQLIFTTHESKIMTLELVRQDEIWFVERNKENESELYSLDRFKERYDKRIEKAYLEGRYGAIPVFSSFDSLNKIEGRR